MGIEPAVMAKIGKQMEHIKAGLWGAEVLTRELNARSPCGAGRVCGRQNVIRGVAR